jgi:hypothetical protein
MDDFHHVKITGGPHGNDSRLEIDDWEVQGVTRVTVSVDAMKVTKVSIELTPRIIEIDSDGEIEMSRKILPIKRREGSE